MTLQEYFRLDGGCALIMEPFGEDSAKIRMEEFLPNSDTPALASPMSWCPTSSALIRRRPIRMRQWRGRFSWCGIWASSRRIAAQARRP